MRLVLLDIDATKRRNFDPISLSRPVWELRCGITNLAQKLIARCKPVQTAGFVVDYLAPAARARTAWPVNDPAALDGDDLLLVSARLKAEALDALDTAGPSVLLTAQDGEVLCAWIRKADLARLKKGSIDELLSSAAAAIRPQVRDLPVWNYAWDLVLANPGQITKDFAAAGKSGVEGSIEEPSAVRGSRKDVYVASGCVIHPMVVIDASNGPVYLDQGVEVHPFTRIEGPCYVGPKCILLGAKCREGMSIGPMCRVGGEVEESIIQGYSNKYHDGFLGHAYVGEWVNLGALTTNSDLKNDYSSVSVVLDGKAPIDTGSTKVGSLIGDHTKTSIATLLNTGSYVGAMALLLGTGKPLPKYIPSFAWFIEGVVSKGFGKGKLYETAKIAMSRRKCQWTQVDQDLWDAVFALTAPQRDEAVRKGRKMMARQ